MMEKMLLGQDWMLRGWDGVPYAVHNIQDKSTVRISQEMMTYLTLLNQGLDVLIDESDESLLKEYQMLAEKHVLVSDGSNKNMSEQQKYHRYSCAMFPSVQWSITGKCNYRCRHCFMSAPDDLMGEPTTEQCLHIIDMLDECGVDIVSLTGGEPLIRKDFWQIVDALIDKHIDISTIYSNGALMNDTFFAELDHRHLKPVFQISFDGVGCHDWLRGVDGAEEIALNAIRQCAKRGLKVCSSMALHKKNIPSVRETVKVLADAGCKELKIDAAYPSGEWMKYPQYCLNTKETFKFYLEYLPQFYEDGQPLTLVLDGMYFYQKGVMKPDEYEVPFLKKCTEEQVEKRFMCGSARRNFYISPTGKVLPCMSMAGTAIEDQFPSLFDTPLVEILHHSAYLRAVASKIIEYMEHNPNCAACPYRYNCCGGCRASAVGSTGTDYLAPDMKACEFFRGGWEKEARSTVEQAIRQYCVK